MKLVIGKTEYNLVKMPRLPKRGNGTVTLKIKGQDVACKITSNKGWNADPATTLEYVWVEHEGTAYYATLDYAQAASSLKDAKATIEEGTSKRPDPKRVTNKVETETARIAKFKATYAANHAE